MSRTPAKSARFTQIAIERRGIDYFRRVVALLYREIGVINAVNHPMIAAKARLDGSFFGPNRKQGAKQLYKLSLTDIALAQTLKRYEERTGLDLKDIHEAFRDGNWCTRSGAIAFGGPKWSAITEATIQLGTAIEGKLWPEVKRLIDLIDTLEHNSERLINKFEQLD
jgi:hypothetical protein